MEADVDVTLLVQNKLSLLPLVHCGGNHQVIIVSFLNYTNQHGTLRLPAFLFRSLGRDAHGDQA